jgi:manganese/zinc/iron transport system permease protein
MIQQLLEFLSFQDANVRYVVFGAMLLAAGSAIVGCFTLLRKRSLVGDAVAHAVLPGVCLAFILGESKNPLLLLLGAFVSGWLSLIAIDLITRRSKIKEDTAIGLVLSIFFGIGILLLTSIQHSGNAAQSGLDKFLFGKTASLIGEDLLVFGIVASLLVIVVIAFFKEFTLLAFDSAYAASLGFPVRKLELLLTTITVMAVVIGIQAVGVVLMAAMIITPAAAARYWTANIVRMIFLAAGFGAFSGLAGAFVSYTAPAMPTGPWIVLIISAIAITSFFTAPGKGIISKMIKKRSTRRRMLEENILKTLYHLAENTQDFERPQSKEEIMQRRYISPDDLKEGLVRLARKGEIKNINEGWLLSKQGMVRARRVVKLHRLWEIYLTRYLHIAPDHVHDDADTIEHIITPELEKKLEQELEFPIKDPHEKEIPY